MGAIAIANGFSLLAGFLTPIASVLALLGGIGIVCSWLSPPPASQFETRLMAGMVMIVAFAIALLGPGSLSLDARLFGRREVIIPRLPRSRES